MATAHELATAAVRITTALDMDSIESWHLEHSIIGGCDRVTLRLTNGGRRTYLVYEEKEEDTPEGESLP